MNCLVCDAELPAPAPIGRPRRYCSAACRQRAYHARHATDQPVFPPENALDANVIGLDGQPAQPLLAEIVLVPVDCQSSVYAAQTFAEFPWRRLLADLSEGRVGVSSNDADNSPGIDEVLNGLDC